MDLKIVLDFDGVLFNSAFEAYSVCNACSRGDERYRQDIPFDEFLEFRAIVTDAWQYNRLYRVDGDRSVEAVTAAEPDSDDWAFSEAFFAARRVMLEDPDWPKVMSPYDFFFLIKPLLINHPDQFYILSTRDVGSIARTLTFYGVDGIPICGQEDIRRMGSKIEAARCFGWLDERKHLIVYVDDMNHHLEPFEGKVHLPLHADWGYDNSGEKSLSQHQVLAIIQSMLKLSVNAPAQI